jgi:hypothetical protein
MRVKVVPHVVEHFSEPCGAIEESDWMYIVNEGDGVELELQMAKDYKTALLFKGGGGSAGSVTIKAGNGIQGVEDLTFGIGPNETRIVCIESGRFKNVSGTDAGKVIIVGADFMMGAIELP